MNANGYSRIPRELMDWITFLTYSLPLRSTCTFIELFCGAMLTTTGFVTDAYLLIGMKNQWFSYYKWLEQGVWSWLKLARQFTRLALNVVKPNVIYLAIDDTLTLRASKIAPASKVHHQHGNKPNLACFVQAQCWVSLAMVVQKNAEEVKALPLVSRLIPSVTNTGKLVAANTLIRSVCQLFKEVPVRLLVDSWYMRKTVILPALKRGFHVIGQIRIDTCLHDQPKPKKPGQRGRPRKYGDKYTPKRIAHLKKTEATLMLYGKSQPVRYRSKILMARFLGGLLVRVVWSEMQSKTGQWKPARLLLCTDTSLTAEQVIESYGLRWSIESMFHELKEAWGLKSAWQQTRQTLNRWVHLTMTGYGVMQLLSFIATPEVSDLCHHSPWRKGSPTTAGQIRKGLTVIFRNVCVRDWWNRKCRKFEPPNEEILASTA